MLCSKGILFFLNSLCPLFPAVCAGPNRYHKSCGPIVPLFGPAQTAGEFRQNKILLESQNMSATQCMQKSETTRNEFTKVK